MSTGSLELRETKGFVIRQKMNLNKSISGPQILTFRRMCLSLYHSSIKTKHGYVSHCYII